MLSGTLPHGCGADHGGDDGDRRAGRARCPRTARSLSLLAGTIAVAGLLSGCAAHSAAAARILVSANACGSGWERPAVGWHTFQIYNGATGAAEVDLINPASGGIYAEVEALGPGTTRPMRVDLGSGSYAFRCLIEDAAAIAGPTRRIGGHSAGERAIVPVTSNDLLGPAREYHAYVTAGLRVLVAQTAALTADIRRGGLAAARSAWLPAHLTYERLGAAYGTFGNFDNQIDTRPDGLAGGVSSPQFTGFYRIEYGLWHGQSAADLTGPADFLDKSVRALQAAFPAMEIDLLDVGLRTHEILENALEFQLTGHDDYGSGTTLATTAANITDTPRNCCRSCIRCSPPGTAGCRGSTSGWTGCSA